MNSLEGLEVLNDTRQNRVMSSKLPEWLRLRWARRANEYRNTGMRFPPFSFVALESDIACDPITSVVSDKPATKKKPDKPAPKRPTKVFSTQAEESPPTCSDLKPDKNEKPKVETSSNEPPANDPTKATSKV